VTEWDGPEGIPVVLDGPPPLAPAQMVGPADVVEAEVAATFDADLAWRLHPQVALRDESFGALAYHYGNRRLVFLKSRRLVELVSSLDRFDSATGAIAATVQPPEWNRYRKALARLAGSGVIDVR
jgi:putative mycofactocin binding protein MftB